MRLLLDTSTLGFLTHPNEHIHMPVLNWISELRMRNEQTFQAFIPEVCDFELRRKFLHLQLKSASAHESLERLDELILYYYYLPVSTAMWRRAADLWATARAEGFSVAPPEALGADVLVAAQALDVNAIVVTENRKHLSHFVTAKSWTEIK